MAQKKRWTAEEDRILVQAITGSSYNLSKCFLTVGLQLGRTKKSVENHWYQTLRFTDLGKKAMFTVGKESLYTGKVYREGGLVQPQGSKNSLWQTILRILNIDNRSMEKLEKRVTKGIPFISKNREKK